MTSGVYACLRGKKLFPSLVLFPRFHWASIESLMAEFHPVCKLTDIAEGESRMFIVNQQMVGIFNLAGVIYALDNRCPHAGASLAQGIVEGDSVTCRIHHWKFRITDGKCLDDDNPGCHVKVFPVKIQNGEIEIEL